LQNLVNNPEFSAEAWNNIAICNEAFGNNERAEKIPEKLFNLFISNIGCDPFSTATYGLYLFRVKNDATRGADYYTKAMKLAKNNDLYQELFSNAGRNLPFIIVEIKCKKEAKDEAQQIIKKCPATLPWYKNTAKKILAEF